MTLYFPPHWKNNFRDILYTIPRSKNRIGVDKWHRVLGALSSMEIDPPGAQGLFSHMQEDLHHVKGNRVTMTNVAHQVLASFCWMTQYLEQHPNILYELVPIQPTLDRYHDTYE